MATVKKSILIDVPVDKVYKFISVPTNLLEVWPSLVEAKDIERLPNGGTKFNWKYKMAGMSFDGTSEDIEVIEGESVTSKSTGGIDSTITWKTHQKDEGTEVTFIGDYTLPNKLLNKLAEGFLVKSNEREAGIILQNLKDRLEK